MNKLFIIGNGFDLAHGMKTSYGDFLVWYINSKLENTLRSNIHEDELSIIEFYQSHKYPRIENILDLKKFLIGTTSITFRPKHAFFEELFNRFSESRWVDIENYYYKFLIDISKSYRRDGSTRQLNAELQAKQLNDCFESIKKHLVQYLSTINMPEKHNVINGILEREIKSALKPNLSNGNGRSSLYFLIFNYTSTLNIYNDLIPFTYSTLNYIHGQSDYENSPPIFGYGDETDEDYHAIERINSNEFLKHFKSFYYMRNSNYQDLSIFMQNDPFETLILGHSCGLSDRVLLKSIFEHDNCSSIKIYYYKRDDGTNDFFEKTQEISRHFRLELKEVMRNKIEPETFSSPLNIADTYNEPKAK